jgi:hypothetical protein
LTNQKYCYILLNLSFGCNKDFFVNLIITNNVALDMKKNMKQNIDIIDFLYTKERITPRLFAQAVKYWDEDLVYYIINNTPKMKLRRFIRYKQYKAFDEAVDTGSLRAVSLLIETAKKAGMIKAMLKGSYGVYDNFSSAVSEGGELIIKLLIDVAKEAGVINEMLAGGNERDYSSFVGAVKYCDFKIVKLLLEAAKEPWLKTQMLKGGDREDYRAFSYAAFLGRAHVIKLLIKEMKELGGELIKEMLLNIGGYNAFANAVSNGRLEVVKLLFDVAKQFKVEDKILSIVKNTLWDKHSVSLMIEGNLDQAMTQILIDRDLENAKALVKLYPSHKWHHLHENAKKIADLYSFDPKELRDLMYFIYISKGFKAVEGTESKLVSLSKNLKNYISKFVIGDNYIEVIAALKTYFPFIIKAIHSVDARAQLVLKHLINNTLPTELKYLSDMAKDLFWQKYDEILLSSNVLDDFQREVVSIQPRDIIEFSEELPKILLMGNSDINGMICDPNQG